MSIAARFKSQIPSVFPAATQPEETPSTYTPHSAEAPDRGFEGEAAEARSTEAPDAGEGRSSFMENEYTHGRSQS